MSTDTHPRLRCLQLYGRGTTDCLGHVALLTDFFVQLAEQKPQTKIAINAVFIASEENSEIPDIGVDKLLKEGYLDGFKNGPLCLSGWGPGG